VGQDLSLAFSKDITAYMKHYRLTPGSEAISLFVIVLQKLKPVQWLYCAV